MLLAPHLKNLFRVLDALRREERLARYAYKVAVATQQPCHEQIRLLENAYAVGEMERRLNKWLREYLYNRKIEY